MNSLVSIIMPCYGMGKYIQQALDSVAAQTYTNWEIIAVDDAGPKDGTEEIVFKFAETYKNHHIQLITHTENRGLSATRNTAIKHANGEYIALLDPDDYWIPEHLEKAMEHFKNDKDLYFYSSFAYLFNDDNPLNIIGIEGYKDWEMKAFPSILCVRNAIPNSSSILRESVFKHVGLYDEHLRFSEDCDLWIRIIENNLKVHINKEPTIYYRKHLSALTSNPNAMRIKTSKDSFVAKHRDWLALNQRVALDRLARQLLLLDDNITCLRLNNNALETRVLIVEQTLSKFKSLPLVKQLLQIKKQLH